MRIATKQFHQQGLRAIAEHQSEIARTQQQLSSGKRSLTSADDPTANGWLIRVREQFAASEQYQRNITVARSRLSVEEAVLADAGDTLQRARELAIQGSNAPLTDNDRHSIATELRQLRAHLLQLANRRDGNGDYLFAGFQSKTTPFVNAAAGGVTFQGDQGQRYLQIGPERQVASDDTGSAVFMQIRNGNGLFTVAADAANSGNGTIAIGSVTDATAFQAHRYRIEFTSADTFDVVDETTASTVLSGQAYVEGEQIQFAGIQTDISGSPAAGDRFFIDTARNQDIFTTVDNLITALEGPTTTAADTAQLQQALSSYLADLDQSREHVLKVRGQIGARLNALDDQEQVNADFMLRLQELGNDLDGLDYAEAASRLNQQLVALQAAQQSFLRIQNLTLFNYMR